jgi:hypothetical protein
MSDQLIARPLPKLLDWIWPIILLRGPLGAWGSLTCSKFTTRFKQLKVPPGGLVPWIFPSLKIRRPPPGLNPRRSSHEVGTLPLDYGGHILILPSQFTRADKQGKTSTLVQTLASVLSVNLATFPVIHLLLLSHKHHHREARIAQSV